ncbi:rhoptry protein, putative [Plasmodium relictum]|uniref:Rhoptry protein, putative n=1 Tax=Plasmodium relictum TaxID=85471 RepID=A0A1J1H6W7_PLARL|nr:rhoptry protein, putative [Plasmodium relictum]CRH00694.1 rhoptry protein, putative [Plasmodium relictum]
MNDISIEQITLQNNFLRELDLFCIFKFIITNDIQIYNEDSYKSLLNIVNSSKIFSIESKNTFSNDEKIYKKFFYSYGRFLKIKNNMNVKLKDEIIKNEKKEIYNNNSLFSKNLNNKNLFEFFKFPKNKEVSNYIKKICIDNLINEPLNINLSFVKFDKKKKKKKGKIKNDSKELFKKLFKSNSDSGILSSNLRIQCTGCDDTQECYKKPSENFKKFFNKTNTSISDSFKSLTNLKNSFDEIYENNYFIANCSNSDESVYNYFSESTNIEDNTDKNKNFKCKNSNLSHRLSMYNFSLLKNSNPLNTFFDDNSLCLNHFYDIHNMLNRDPIGLRKIKIMLKKDIGTISISPFYINFDCSRIFENVCRTFNLNKYDYKKQNLYHIINLCFSNENSLSIIKNIFLDDLYKQQKIYENELNYKKNYRKRNSLNKKNTENILEILDDEKRINVLYFINRFLYSQKTPLSYLFRDYTINEYYKDNNDADKDLYFDELTVDYFLFLMIFEKKIEKNFYKYLIKKIHQCKRNFVFQNKDSVSSSNSINNDKIIKKEQIFINDKEKQKGEDNKEIRTKHYNGKTKVYMKENEHEIYKSKKKNDCYNNGTYLLTNYQRANEIRINDINGYSKELIGDKTALEKGAYLLENIDKIHKNDNKFSSNEEIKCEIKNHNHSVGTELNNLINNTTEENSEENYENFKKMNENEIILLKCIRPFPTIYWLINKNVCAYISHLEKINIIKNIEKFINHRNDEFNLLRYYLIYDHLKYIVIRLRHINKRILIFFYNFFVNSDNFLNQYASKDIMKSYNNSFEVKPVANEYFKKYQTNSNVVSEILRKINTLRIKGIGGISNFLTLKCIHLHFASHLSYPNTIGYILEEYFKS